MADERRLSDVLTDLGNEIGKLGKEEKKKIAAALADVVVERQLSRDNEQAKLDDALKAFVAAVPKDLAGDAREAVRAFEREAAKRGPNWYAKVGGTVFGDHIKV